METATTAKEVRLPTLQRILQRTIAWFASLLFAVCLFCLHFRPNSVDAFFWLARITLIVALPAAFLYLPVVIAINSTDRLQLRNLWIGGVLIGPVSLLAWGCVTSLWTGTIWKSDPLAPGLGACMMFALIVGLLTMTFYVLLLNYVLDRNFAR